MKKVQKNSNVEKFVSVLEEEKSYAQVKYHPVKQAILGVVINEKNKEELK